MLHFDETLAALVHLVTLQATAASTHVVHGSHPAYPHTGLQVLHSSWVILCAQIEKEMRKVILPGIRQVGSDSNWHYVSHGKIVCEALDDRDTAA